MNSVSIHLCQLYLLPHMIIMYQTTLYGHYRIVL